MMRILAPFVLHIRAHTCPRSKLLASTRQQIFQSKTITFRLSHHVWTYLVATQDVFGSIRRRGLMMRRHKCLIYLSLRHLCEHWFVKSGRAHLHLNSRSSLLLKRAFSAIERSVRADTLRIRRHCGRKIRLVTPIPSVCRQNSRLSSFSVLHACSLRCIVKGCSNELA